MSENPFKEYVKNFDIYVTSTSEEEAEECFVRSGLVVGALIGEALIEGTSPVEEC